MPPKKAILDRETPVVILPLFHCAHILFTVASHYMSSIFVPQSPSVEESFESMMHFACYDLIKVFSKILKDPNLKL